MIQRDLTGEEFGDLIVLGRSPIGYKKPWKCQCICGNITFAHGFHLKNGKRVSCGCRKYNVEPVKEKINRKIKKIDGCWIWQAGTCKDGYGQISYGSKTYRAHRLSYEAYIGKIPKGLIIMHSCDNPLCVNPKHLLLGTHQDNTDDKIKKGRQTILRGESVSNSKLTEAQVLLIRARLASTRWGSIHLTITTFAKSFSVSPGAISDVYYRKSWRHI